MPTRITLMYNQPQGGWTETWYSNASVPTFLDPNTIIALNQSVGFRAGGTSLYGVRYTSLDGAQLSRFFRTSGPSYISSEGNETPDVTQTACEFRVQTTGGAKKIMWIRGLLDIDIRRTPQFVDTPTGRLTDFIKGYIQASIAAGWGIQVVNSQRSQGLVGNRVIAIAPDPALPLQQAIITLTADPTGVLPVKSVVRFSGVVKDSTPGMPRLATVLALNGPGKTITIGYNLRNQGVVNPPKCFAWAYGATISVPNAQLSEFIREAEHKVGRPFGVLAGRERVQIRRY